MADTITTTYSNQSSGVREMSNTIWEDVEGVIQNISPTDTKFISSIGRKGALNTLHEWLEDDLPSAPTTSAAVEGADQDASARIPASRLNNQTQIIKDVFAVSGTQEAVKTIGRQTESAYQLAKSLKVVAIALNKAALNNTAAVAGDASTARQMKGLSGFIATNDESFASNASTNLFTETKLMAMAKGAYNAGGTPSNLYISPDQAVVIADWDQNSRITVNTNAAEKTLVMAVMILETPFGRIKVMLERHIAVTTETTPDPDEYYDTVYLVDPNKCDVAFLRKTKTEQLAKTGDNKKFQTVCEATFVCHSEKAHAKCGGCFGHTA